MRVLLLYPEFPDTFWSYTHALRFIGKRAVQPPLGLLTVAAMLPKDWEVRLVDLNVRSLRPRDLAWANMAFVSAMTVQQASAREVLQRCRAAGLKIVAGGPLFTSQPEAFPEVDHLVLNEAELTLPPFLEDWHAHRPRRIYTTTEYADMALSPLPRFELADLRRYAMMPVQYCRGCPFDCEFCDVTAQLGHRPRQKSVTQILAELQRLRDLGWRSSVFFVDDNLIGNKKHLKTELLPALIEWQKHSGPTVFNSQVSINLADDPVLIDLMARAGFSTVFVGIETPDADALRACGKNQNVSRDLLADVHRLQAAGIAVQAGFIVGFDHDTPSIFQRQIDFIQASGIATAMVGLLQAIKGTRLYARLQREDRLREEFQGDNVAVGANFVPMMDDRVLREGYGRVLQTIYSPRGYYQRLRTFLRQYQLPRIRERFRFQDLKAFVRANLRLGILGRERFCYWRLLMWTMLHRPRLLATAVRLAVLGHHYRRICQGYTRSLQPG
jgi:radical SAM superfamily enzyme YgiQ (UPF0313 family)